MSLTAEQIFDAIAPSYASNASKAVYLEMSEDRTSACAFGSNRPQAVALRAAHMITLDLGGDQSGSGGQITGKKEGNLSLTFAGPSASQSDDDLSMTKYGKQLKGLIKGNITLASIANGVNYGC